ncbi:D-glycero-beta-D-manno-heptose-1,7-bisphosphate 7-phosphatase [hydrothermal vent metagenome]|uniref:D,D-heptose 1,7-bisphosphate phosphatase n=1 Tax=hydrothermal vent metagenome TaxID=652676 RepID=A0A3B0YEJ6_9ZZZZ
MTAKLIILDRDGVINHDSDKFIKSPEEWIPISGSLEAIANLNKSGYKVVVVTNQSGLARGLFDINSLASIHQKMHQKLSEVDGKIEEIIFCPHGPDDRCQCRKPSPGMLLEIASRLEIDLKNIPVVGDSLRDLQAGMAVGARPILVKTGKGRKTLNDPQFDKSISIYGDLSEFVTNFLNNTMSEHSGEK